MTWLYQSIKGLVQEAQWLSGRVLDSILRGCGFGPHRRHCIVSLSKTLVLVQTRKTCRFITERLLVGRKETNQTNKQESWSQGYKTFPCSTQLKTKLQLLIKAKIWTNEDVSCSKYLISCINYSNTC